MSDSLAGIFQAAGIQDIREYYYWDYKQRGICLEKLLEDLTKAPEQSVVVLSASAHYPTGAALSQNQWAQIANVIMVTYGSISQTLNKNGQESSTSVLLRVTRCLVTLPTAAPAFPLLLAAASGALLRRLRAGCLARSVLCVAGDGAPLCPVVLPLLRAVW